MTETPRLAVDPHVVASPGGQTAPNRRGTILVFVLGTLTLLLLIGVGLLSTVRGERARWQRLRSAQVEPQLLDQVVQTVRERLRADLWSPGKDAMGNVRTPQYLDDYLGGVGGYDTAAESNEPYDAPGPADRWLASTLPFVVRVPNSGALVTVPTGTSPGEPTIAWPRVSYLGSDVISSDVQDRRGIARSQQTMFCWASSSRDGQQFYGLGNPASNPIYGNDLSSNGLHDQDRGSFNSFVEFAGGTKIEGLPVLLSPPPVAGYASVGVTDSSRNYIQIGATKNFLNFPGTTTDISIANARRLWDLWGPGGGNRPAPGIGTPTPAFPYFDTNMDGIVDLYDADGDGIPDSPISFALPYPGRDPNDPSRVYAAIRIIDNASMINVNTASPLLAPDTPLPGRLSFDEQAKNWNTTDYPLSDYQRRGRYPSDVIIDFAARSNDAAVLGVSLGRTASIPRAIFEDPVSGYSGVWFNPSNFHRFVSRGPFIGGHAPYYYNPYSISDEVSLRNRFLLPPPALAGFDKQNQLPNDYTTIDAALRWTLLWNRNWNTTNPNNYQQDLARYGRWSTNTVAAAGSIESVVTSITLELSQASGSKGWKTLITDDAEAPWGIRRPMFTTTSLVASRRPGGGAGWVTPPGVGTFIADVNGSVLPVTAIPQPIGKVPLNPVWWNAALDRPRDPTPAEKLQWLTELVYAIYNGLTANSQLDDWLPKDSPSLANILETPVPPVVKYAPEARERIAWQLAVNIVDYADGDNDPTVIFVNNPLGAPPILPPLIRYVGQERQPFLCKAASKQVFDAMGNSDPTLDEYAVEVINPYPTSDPIAPNAVYRIKVLDANGVEKAAVGAHEFTVILPLAGAAGPGRVIVTTDPGETTSPSQPNSRTETFANLELDDDDVVVLFRRVFGSSFATADQVEWPIDSMRLTGLISSNGTAGTATLTYFRRDDRDWKFTTDAIDYDQDDNRPDTEKLDMTPATVMTIAEPSQWVIRNGGFQRMEVATVIPVENFDSPADLSRLVVAGVPSHKIGLPGSVPPFYFGTIPRLMSNALPGASNADERMGICRLNFFTAGVNSNRQELRGIFDHLAVSALSRDGVDNDGDGVLDEREEDINPRNGRLDAGEDVNGNGRLDHDEATKLAFRVPGLINVNTAPATVLRAVPFMSSQSLNGTPPPPPTPPGPWDLAAAIVARREARVVRSPVTTTNAPAGTGSNLHYKSVADVIELDGAAPADAFSAIRFGHDGQQLAAHVPTNNLSWWSPDFDAEQAADDAETSPNNDIRERDVLLSRWSNILTTRSDVYTVYIALIDENGRFLRRTQFTLDRSVCASEDTDAPSRRPVLPAVLGRVDTDYADDTR